MNVRVGVTAQLFLNACVCLVCVDAAAQAATLYILCPSLV